MPIEPYSRRAEHQKIENRKTKMLRGVLFILGALILVKVIVYFVLLFVYGHDRVSIYNRPILTITLVAEFFVAGLLEYRVKYTRSTDYEPAVQTETRSIGQVLSGGVFILLVCAQLIGGVLFLAVNTIIRPEFIGAIYAFAAVEIHVGTIFLFGIKKNLRRVTNLALFPYIFGVPAILLFRVGQIRTEQSIIIFGTDIHLFYFELLYVLAAPILLYRWRTLVHVGKRASAACNS